MNPALPEGATDASQAASGGDWRLAGGISYTGISYSKLQQGTDSAPNPNELEVDVQLATPRIAATAPTGTTIGVQLPIGRLSTSTIDDSRTDTNIGDAEVRVSQLIPTLRRPQVQATLGVALPTGPYVERSGAANLPPEASFLTLGRGVPWALAEIQANLVFSKRFSSYAQLSARTPLGRTSDEFDWGSEARIAIGGRVGFQRRFAALAIAEWQWRGGASEPDPFSDMRLTSANAGGNWFTLTPALTAQATRAISVLAGLRIPVLSDVKGNQLVPGLGGFVALSATWSPTGSPNTNESLEKSTVKAKPQPLLGRITVIDYWATWCAPCKEIDEILAKAEPSWDDVAIIKVNASGWPSDGTPIPKEASGLPAIEVYDQQGERVHLLLGEEALLVAEKVNMLRERTTQ